MTTSHVARRLARDATPAAGAAEWFASRRGIGSLYFGLLAGPTAVLVAEEVAYLSVQWSCEQRRHAVLHLVPALLLLVTVAAGYVAWRDWRQAGDVWPDEDGDDGSIVGRSRFMAALGLAGSALSFLTIVAQWIPIFYLGPCVTT